MTPGVVVRSATAAADVEAAGRLLHDFSREFDEPSPESAVLAGRLRELIAAGDTTVLLAGTRPDGLAVLRFRPAIRTAALECHLAVLFIVPGSRGQGLGRALMNAAIELARSQGADRMDLGVSEADLPARRLYESLGFSNCEGREGGPLTYYYEREL